MYAQHGVGFEEAQAKTRSWLQSPHVSQLPVTWRLERLEACEDMRKPGDFEANHLTSPANPKASYRCVNCLVICFNDSR